MCTPAVADFALPKVTAFAWTGPSLTSASAAQRPRIEWAPPCQGIVTHSTRAGLQAADKEQTQRDQQPANDFERRNRNRWVG